MLDLVNTIHWRLDPGHRTDELETYLDVLDWCAESSLITDSELRALQEKAGAQPEAVASEHLAVIGARESTYTALFAGSADALADLTELHRDAAAEAGLARVGDTFAWADVELTLATPRHRIVRGLVDVLTRDDLDRLHQCEDRACGWVYLDTSPRRNRRWCVAADCGDRNRARAYYARNKAAPVG
jgi:predicted RNA-binding Zn ribbon-like protein